MPKPSARGKRRKRLKRLDPEKQKAVDALLVRVYTHAAKELKEMEKRQVVELHREDRELAKSYEQAREEIMRALARCGEPEDAS